MPIGFSEQDLELLGYSGVKKVEGGSENTPIQLYEATAIAGIRTVTHNFAYLNSSCTLDAARELVKRVKVSDNFFLVTPRSGLSKYSLKRIFGKNANVSILEDLIWGKLNDIFSDYVQSLSKEIIQEQYYVIPRSEGTTRKEDRLDNEILAYLEGRGGNINVISASAGVGKTTLARHVVLTMAKRYVTKRLIPTFVEASHWGRLKLESVDDLWDIISNSLANFSPNLSITEALFKHALKQGYIVFIFDGFDELCTQQNSHFNARELLQWLIEISKETEARIVITTRTLFWDAEVGREHEYITLHKLRSFEKAQAKEYFQKYFSDLKLQDIANNLYAKLIRQSHRPRNEGGGRAQFVNLPVCVGIIARYVSEEGTHLDISSEGTLIEQFLEQILERERERQHLLTPAKSQLLAFEEIAISSINDLPPKFDLELLEAAGFIKSDIRKLNVHPLISKNGLEYTFSYAFLESYLLASYLARVIKSGEIKDRTIWLVMVKEANGKGHVIEHLVELLGPGSENSLGAFYQSVPSDQKTSKSFLFHVAEGMVDAHSSVVTAQERADAVFDIIMGEAYKDTREVRAILVIGNIVKFDFSDTTLRDCVFDNTHFVQCKANNNTRFINCSFSGDMLFENCTRSEWEKVVLDDCNMEPPTHLVWEGLIGRSWDSNDDHVLDAMHLALMRFWRHGRFKGSIRGNDWKKGTLGHSIYCQPILDKMVSVGVLETTRISGTSEGGYAFNRDLLWELQLFMDNRQLSGKLKEVYKALKRH